MMNSFKIVVIADHHILNLSEISGDSTDLDKTSIEQLQELVAALKPICAGIKVYSSIHTFFCNINENGNNIIFPYWYGEHSRNRAALIPAVCEAANIRFVGGDAYVRLICSDKAISKTFIKRVGITTPPFVLVEREKDSDLVNLLQYPVVIKPNNENSSIGITENSLVQDHRSAQKRAIHIKKTFGCGALVEEFRQGRETFVCIIGSQHSIDFIEFGERFVPRDESFFVNRIFGFELKKLRTVKSQVRCISQEAPEGLFEKAKELFQRLGKIEMLRIDGRLNEEGFHAIELTPSPLLTTSSDFLGTFLDAGYELKDLFGAIVRNAWDSTKINS